MQNKIGFIGAGNMTTAMVNGILTADFMCAENIFVYDILPEKFKFFTDLGVNFTENAQKIIDNCDFIFLAMKPQSLKKSLENLNFSAGKCVVSIAAGVDIATLKSYIAQKNAIIRAMPNTPILVGEGATAIAICESVTSNQVDFIAKLFETSGMCVEVDESAINTITALSGSGPAYFFKIAKSATEFAKSTNLNSKLALKLFAQTMTGAGKMLLEGDKTPEELIDAVASKGGTTEAALKFFDENNFEEIIISAMNAAKNRADELAE